MSFYNKKHRKKRVRAEREGRVETYDDAAPVPVLMTPGVAAQMGLCPLHSDYKPDRPPRAMRLDGQPCDTCWCVYNAQHDLPVGNMHARSATGVHGARLSRLIPPVESAYTVTGAPYNGRSTDLTLPIQILHRDRFVVTSVSIDASPTSTGVAVLGYYDAPAALGQRRWLAMTYTVGQSLSLEAGALARVKRQVAIAAAIIHTLRLVSKRGPEGGMPSIFIEDHAYEAGGARAHDMVELHGTIKSQIYLTFGCAPESVSIKEAPATVYHDGNSRKEAARRNLLAAGWAWTEKITADEIDALTIGLADLRRKYPLGVVDRLATDTHYYQATRTRGAG